LRSDLCNTAAHGTGTHDADGFVDWLHRGVENA
jgi:hypothetical protein